MTDQNYKDMTGKVLIASPFAMEGNVFHQSLIYVIKHAEDSSVGLIFNHPVNSSPNEALFRKVDESIKIGDLDMDVRIGGPVELERGFFLHSDEYDKNLLFQPSEGNIAVSSNPQILDDINVGKGPKDKLFIIGYTAWAPGQMEFELEHNLWIVSEPDNKLIFHTEAQEQWHEALKSAGVAEQEFVPTAARC